MAFLLHSMMRYKAPLQHASFHTLQAVQTKNHAKVTAVLHDWKAKAAALFSLSRHTQLLDAQTVTQIILDDDKNYKILLERFTYIAQDSNDQIHAVAICDHLNQQRGFDLVALASNPANLSAITKQDRRVKGAGTAILQKVAQDILLNPDPTKKLTIFSCASAAPFYRKFGPKESFPILFTFDNERLLALAKRGHPLF